MPVTVLATYLVNYRIVIKFWAAWEGEEIQRNLLDVVMWRVLVFVGLRDILTVPDFVGLCDVPTDLVFVGLCDLVTVPDFVGICDLVTVPDFVGLCDVSTDLVFFWTL